MDSFTTLTPAKILIIIGFYFMLLVIIAQLTGRKSSNQTFFTADRQSPWFLVAFGMIGASLSGVTFISIPGVVGAGGYNQSFSYLQMVMGYLLGYLVISTVLLPVYYRLGLTTIYGFLREKLGWHAYKTGAAYFLLSRIIGASFRLFLVAMVLDQFVFGPMHIPFFVTVTITILLIWVYTFQGGIKTIVWTDSLQTLSMLGAVAVSVYLISNAMEWSLSDIPAQIRQSDLGQVFFFEGGWEDPNNFFKQFISGALITIVMTGLDQDMMQKNLTCKNLKEAQLNMSVFSVILFFANLLFLSLGALLYIFAAEKGLSIPQASDHFFPDIALNHLPALAGILFVIGIIAAAYSSADSALTALTTSFCVDFLNFDQRDDWPEKKKKGLRLKVHLAFSAVLFCVILIFAYFSDEAVIHQLFIAAGYTYGPLLGLFVFSFIPGEKKVDHWSTIAVCIAGPLLSYWINSNSDAWLGGFQWGYLILLLNGVLCLLGLILLNKFRLLRS